MDGAAAAAWRCPAPPSPRPADAQRRRRPPRTPSRAIDFSADQVELRQRGRDRHRVRRGAHVARRQSPRRRPGRLEPRNRRGPRRGQCRRRQSAGRQVGRRQCRPDRHAARRNDRQSAGRARKRRTHRRRSAATRSGDRHDPRECGLFALPGHDRDRLPAQPELGDHRRAGDPRPGAQPDPLPAAAGCELFGVTLPLLPIFSVGTGGDGEGVSGFLVPDISFRQQQRASSSPCPITGGSRPTATSRSRRTSTPSALPAIEARYRELNRHRRLPGRRLPHLRQASTMPTRLDDDSGRRARASAPISKPTARRSSIRCGASPARSGSPPTRPSPAATTSPATTGCAASSTPSGSAPTATSRSPAGRSRACASTTSRSRSRSRLPAIDARFRLDAPMLGGKVELQANSLAILRIDGQDTQRAFASARWDLRRLTPLGPGADAHRASPRRRLSHRRIRRAPRCRSIAAPTAGIPRHRRARRRHQMAVGRPGCSAAPSG